VVEFGPAGTVFLKPIQILLPIDATVTLGAGETFVGAYFNATRDEWVELTTVGIVTRGGVTFAQVETTHFTQFAALAASPPPPPPTAGGGGGGGGSFSCQRPLAMVWSWDEPFCDTQYPSYRDCGAILSTPYAAPASLGRGAAEARGASIKVSGSSDQASRAAAGGRACIQVRVTPAAALSNAFCSAS